MENGRSFSDAGPGNTELGNQLGICLVSCTWTSEECSVRRVFGEEEVREGGGEQSLCESSGHSEEFAERVRIGPRLRLMSAIKKRGRSSVWRTQMHTNVGMRRTSLLYVR